MLAPIAPPALPPSKRIELQELVSNPSWEDIEALIRDEAGLCFRIDIETDSTIKVDQEIEKRNRIEFLTACSGFISQLMNIQDPRMLPLAGEMLLFGVRAFKTGRSLEGAIENLVASYEDNPQNSQQKPNPEMMKVQAQSASRAQEMQLESRNRMAEMQLNAQLEAKKIALQAQANQRSDQNEAAQDVARTQAEQARDQADAANDMKMKVMETMMDAKMKMMEENLKQQTALIIAHINAASKIESSRVAAAADDGSQAFQFEQARES